MFDTVNFWIDRVNISGGNPFDMLPYLSEITERQNDKSGYSCMGKAGDYTVNLYKNGVSLKGSLSKYFFPSNLYTHTRKTTKQAIEQLSDCLHTDIKAAKVTRLDVSTVFPMQRPPADYYPYLGNKPHFNRIQSTINTLYYGTEKRQLVFYDKTKEAAAKGTVIPDTFKNCNLLRYELRWLNRLNRQLNADVTAAILYDKAFYYSIVQNWHTEFKTIRKLKNTSVMIDGITTPKEAKEALFAVLLQQGGQSVISDFLNDLKAENVFADKKYYSRLKRDLNAILESSTGQKNELIKELETAIFDVAKYAR